MVSSTFFSVTPSLSLSFVSIVSVLSWNQARDLRASLCFDFLGISLCVSGTLKRDRDTCRGQAGEVRKGSHLMIK